MPCKLDYIPPHLLPNGRENVQVFSIGERLYRRCKQEEIDNPFDRISLIDLSVNRSGADNSISNPSDVLLNTNPKSDIDPQVLNFQIAELLIHELDENSTYVKEFVEETENPDAEIEVLRARIELKHRKEDCNYAHCAFEIYFNGLAVTFENYEETIGMKKGIYKSKVNKLRTACKHEIHLMILKRILRLHW